jgi:hypothetical protein
MTKNDPLLPPPKTVEYVVTPGAYHPVMGLRLWSSDDWEDFVFECVSEIKKFKKEYSSVKRLGGAGDKGRDVEALYELTRALHKWDLYQCKHYDAPISPSTFFPELAKFFGHVAINSYPEPARYYLCAPQNCGTDLNDLLTGDPEVFRDAFLNAWRNGNQGLKPLMSNLDTTVELVVENFDFSRIKEFQARDLVAWHERDSQAHYRRFGVKPKRSKSPAVPKKPSKKEQKYIEQLLLAYAEDLGRSLSIEDLPDTDHLEHFEGSRAQFYSAEGLRIFSRDIFPKQFDELLDEIKGGVRTAIANKTLLTGLDRVHKAVEIVSTFKITENPLSSSLRAPDLPGACHHLANRGQIKWVK